MLDICSCFNHAVLYRRRAYLALYASNTRVYNTPSSSNVTLSAVIAFWLGISSADSFKLLTYAMRSRNGNRIARPGSRIRWNFPIRSTIHAVCCGTNRTIVFAGRVAWLVKYVVGPPDGLCEAAELPPNWPKRDSGARLRLEFESARHCIVGRAVWMAGRGRRRCCGSKLPRDRNSFDDWRDAPSILRNCGRMCGDWRESGGVSWS